MFGVVTFHDAMVDWERQPLLLRLILFLVRKYVKEIGVLPHLFRVQTAKVVVHEGFNCLVNVINYAFQLVILVGVNLNVVKDDKNVSLKICSAFVSPDVERWRPSVSETWSAAWCVVGEPACQPFHVWEDNSSTGNWQHAATGQLLVASVQSCGRSRNISRWRTNLSQQIYFWDRNWKKRKMPYCRTGRIRLARQQCSKGRFAWSLSWAILMWDKLHSPIRRRKFSLDR